MTKSHEEYRRLSDVAQQTAWDMKHIAEECYEAGKFSLASQYHKSYEKHVKDAIYYTQLSLKS